MALVRYFAYGSNMQSHTLRGRRTIEPACATAACTEGWRLVLDKPSLMIAEEGMANILPDTQSRVCGVLYEISEDDLAHLDLTEGVLIGNYTRIEIIVRPLHDSEGTGDVAAFTYVSQRRTEGILPSARYMGLLIDGALEHGLPEAYIEHLRSFATRPETPEAALWRPVLDHAMKRT
ncbi:MAG TPA: gamma-glutamylcyclotransferase [Candidatus Limnocylindrales bacterium]|nr:gamma-glutamylcyclotransferase [Candidatus Limnocylindrales bacterium]